MSKYHEKFKRKIAHIANNLKRDSLAHMDLEDESQHVHPDFSHGKNIFAGFTLIPYNLHRLEEMANFVNHEAKEYGINMGLVLNYDEKNNRCHVIVAPPERAVRRELWEEDTERFLGKLPRFITRYRKMLSGYTSGKPKL